MRTPFARSISALLLALLLAVAGAQWVSPAHAQVEPVDVEPPDGSSSDVPPNVHICFPEPILGDFEISYVLPDGSEAGVRVAFDPSGECLDIEPILPAGATGGEYTVEWRVTVEASGDQASGELTYDVGEEGVALPTPTPGPTPVPTATPAATATPGPTPAATQSPTAVGTPAPTETPTPAATPEPAPGGTGDSGEPDILEVALWTAMAVAGVAVIGLPLYLVRRAVGFDWHRPAEESQDGGDEH